MKYKNISLKQLKELLYEKCDMLNFGSKLDSTTSAVHFFIVLLILLPISSYLRQKQSRDTLLYSS